MNWYAVFVRTGKEDEVCDNLKKLYEFFSPKDQYEVIVPKRGVYEYHEGRRDYVLRTLFPSYVLIGTNQILKLYEIMKRHKSLHIIKLLKNDTFFEEINEREIDSIINLINKINRRKGRGKIQVDFLNRKCFVDIAIRCLEKYKEDNVKNQITFS